MPTEIANVLPLPLNFPPYAYSQSSG